MSNVQLSAENQALVTHCPICHESVVCLHVHYKDDMLDPAGRAARLGRPHAESRGAGASRG